MGQIGCEEVYRQRHDVIYAYTLVIENGYQQGNEYSTTTLVDLLVSQG